MDNAFQNKNDTINDNFMKTNQKPKGDRFI